MGKKSVRSWAILTAFKGSEAKMFINKPISKNLKIVKKYDFVAEYM